MQQFCLSLIFPHKPFILESYSEMVIQFLYWISAAE